MEVWLEGSIKVTVNKQRGNHLRIVMMSIIGASLSEPHTSVTALQKVCVCPLACLLACGHIP